MTLSAPAGHPGRRLLAASVSMSMGDPPAAPVGAWRALWVMIIGFFMILVDSTIVAVANPAIMAAFGVGDYDDIVWVTSAYLLAFAVPLLLTGRLGDRFGPKNLYLAGLAVFTAASLWCGLSSTLGMLIAARVLQGLGAALLTPQTLSMITRIFPAQRRGVALSVWGTTAGLATLVGPLAGGLIVDTLGWSWIFIINVPVGVLGLALAARFVPALPTRPHRLDLPGVALSGTGLFLIVFGLQEGQAGAWRPWIWVAITVGVGLLAGFVYWQSVNRLEPLIPLGIFTDRNFGLANAGVAVIGFAVTGMVLPLMFYAQGVLGFSPGRAALLMAPMAVASMVLAPFVGRLVDSVHPRPIVGSGFAVLSVSLLWLSMEMTTGTPMWRLQAPMAAMGIGMAFIWSPLSATATRNLPPLLAGAGSGVYNTTRQVGSVLGSAGMAALMSARVSAELPGAAGGSDVSQLPGTLRPSFAAAMSQSMLLPACAALVGVLAAAFLLNGLAGARPVQSNNTAGLR
jgi:EmrB/QacA subfamily drug resistance transporter